MTVCVFTATVPQYNYPCKDKTLFLHKQAFRRIVEVNPFYPAVQLMCINVYYYSLNIPPSVPQYSWCKSIPVKCSQGKCMGMGIPWLISGWWFQKEIGISAPAPPCSWMFAHLQDQIESSFWSGNMKSNRINTHLIPTGGVGEKWKPAYSCRL